MDGTPDPFRPSQRPLVSSPGLWSVVRAKRGLFLVRAPPAFRDLRRFPPAAFTSRSLSSTKPATLLSIALRRCRPTACSVCTLPLSRIGPSQSPLVFSPGPSRVPCAALSHSAHPTLIGGDFPRERLPISVARALTSRFSGPRGPCGDFRAAPPAACSGLHATPAVLAQQSFLTPNRGQDPDDPRRSRVFESPER
jgi:hypothetical protein